MGSNMKQQLKINASFENLYEILIAPIQSLLLLAGIELGVFNHLSEPRTADTVAAAIGAHLGNTRLFLNGLAACDLVTKKYGTYRNTAIAQEFLVGGSQTFMGPMLTIIAQAFFAIDDLPKLVREGPRRQRPERVWQTVISRHSMQPPWQTPSGQGWHGRLRRLSRGFRNSQRLRRCLTSAGVLG